MTVTVRSHMHTCAVSDNLKISNEYGGKDMGDENKKLRLLVCFIQAHIGGAMTSLINFLNALDTSRYKVDVMFYENSGGRHGIKQEINILPQGRIHSSGSIRNAVRKLCSPRYVTASVRAQYYKRVRHNKRRAVQLMSKQGCRYSARLDKEYDAAIAYEFGWCMNYVMTRVNARKKLIWNHLEYGRSGLSYAIDRRAFERADALVFVSEECRRTFLLEHPEHSTKSYFVPNLLTSSYVRARGEGEAELPFTDEDCKLKLLTVARISFEHKGLDRVVRSFAKLRDEGLTEGVKWVIIGKGRDADRLCELINEYKLENVIYPIGVKENPIPYMKRFDALLLPSRHEGKPMVVTEGYIMGLVPIVTRYTSAAEQIQNGIDGLIFENNEKALTDGLRSVLSNPSRLCSMREYIKCHDYGNEKEIGRFDMIMDDLFEKG